MRSDSVDKIRKATGVPMSHVVVPANDARALTASSALPLVMVVATEATINSHAYARALEARGIIARHVALLDPLKVTVRCIPMAACGPSRTRRRTATATAT